MNRKILFVDDDVELLMSFRRQLRKQFDIETATSGEMGLDMTEAEDPFAVVVSDMRMPLMDGIQFLSHMRELSPNTVRIMLTGQTDLQTAIDAVNEGHIFRFFIKPGDPAKFIKSLEAGIEQYRLVTAERELLEKTLNGSLTILAEILSLVNPDAFSRSTRAKKYVRHIVLQLNIPNGWQYELAAALSQIGFVSLPPDLVEMAYMHEALTLVEKQMIAEHYKLGRKLLEHIPRLENIALMIEQQQKTFWEYGSIPAIEKMKPTDFGAQILKVALDFDQLIRIGLSPKDALGEMAERKGVYNPKLLSALKDYEPLRGGWEKIKIRVNAIKIGMVVEEDIRTKAGALLVNRGQEVTLAVREMVRSFHVRSGVVEPFYMLVPQKGS